MSYPYRDVFLSYLNQQHLAAATQDAHDQTLTNFFEYLLQANVGFAEHPDINNVFDRDIQQYFSWLVTQRHANQATLNKILSHINRYFKYLFTHQLTVHLPTLELHGSHKPDNYQTSIKWLSLLDTILTDDQVHYYTRLTLFLISKGYQSEEFLQPHFYLEWQNIKPSSPAETAFIRSFTEFIKPIQARQRSSDIFLKQRLDLAHPQLTNPALHKYLHRDSQYLGFSLAPSRLRQSHVLFNLRQLRDLSDSQLETRLHLDPQSLLYYQQLALKRES